MYYAIMIKIIIKMMLHVNKLEQKNRNIGRKKSTGTGNFWQG